MLGSMAAGESVKAGTRILDTWLFPSVLLRGLFFGILVKSPGPWLCLTFYTCSDFFWIHPSLSFSRVRVRGPVLPFYTCYRVLDRRNIWTNPLQNQGILRTNENLYVRLTCRHDRLNLLIERSRKSRLPHLVVRVLRLLIAAGTTLFPGSVSARLLVPRVSRSGAAAAASTAASAGAPVTAAAAATAAAAVPGTARVVVSGGGRIRCDQFFLANIWYQGVWPP